MGVGDGASFHTGGRSWAAMRQDGMSYRQIAEASGVSDATVRRSTASNDAVQPAVVVGKDGKVRLDRDLPGMV